MRNMTKLIATAVVALATGVASAQAMKADIPFAFRAGEKMMAPGKYTVRANGGVSNLVQVYNADTKDSAMLLPASKATASKEWRAKGEPVLAFDCATGHCSLISMWTADDDRALTFYNYAGKGGAAAMIRLVRLTAK